MFKDEYQKRKNIVENILKEELQFKNTKANILYESMKYSMFAGGKRLRPILAMESFKLFNASKTDILEKFMVAIEMIHTFSLIHDDLPAMDDDDYRRGKLTNHKVYGEGIAVLAGDSLLNYAYELILKQMVLKDNNELSIKALDVLMNAIGPNGIMAGQIVDLISENKLDIDIDTLRYIHEYKTTIFIRACLKVGAILAGADEASIDMIDRYGYKIGLAFQIRDDILDIIGNEQKIGKPVGSDDKNHKITYVSLRGIDGAIKEVDKLTEEAIYIIKKLYNKKGQFLIELAQYLAKRDI